MTISASGVSASRRGRYLWIPRAFAGGLAVVIAVNIGLAYFALRSAPGTVSDQPYEEGLAYDCILARAAATSLWRMIRKRSW